MESAEPGSSLASQWLAPGCDASSDELLRGGDGSRAAPTSKDATDSMVEVCHSTTPQETNSVDKAASTQLTDGFATAQGVSPVEVSTHPIQAGPESVQQKSSANVSSVASDGPAVSLDAPSGTNGQLNLKGLLGECIQKLLKVSIAQKAYTAEATGPDHARQFSARVDLSQLGADLRLALKWEGELIFKSSVCGKTKILAEQEAARIALQALFPESYSQQRALPSLMHLPNSDLKNGCPPNTTSPLVMRSALVACQEDSCKKHPDIPAVSACTEGTLPGAETKTSTMPGDLQRWCVSWKLPQEVFHLLESHEILEPFDLSFLGEQDIDVLCADMKLGHKARLKRALAEMEQCKRTASGF